MDKELTKIIEKRKQYLDSQKVFKSPDEFQWGMYKGKEITKKPILQSPDSTLLIVGETVLGVSTLVSGFTGFLLNMLGEFLIGSPLIILCMILLVTYIISVKGIPKFIPTKGNKYNNLGDYNQERYARLHKLAYVKGEFYRVWYIKYVLKLDPSTFVMTDPLYKHLLEPENRITHKGISTFNGDSQTRYLYTPDQITELLNSVDEDGKVTGYTNEEDLDIEEIGRVNTLLREAREERDHWINSLTTARFLDYKEFVKIQEMDEAIDKAKELDIKVQQFEEYMKNKSKKREGK